MEKKRIMFVLPRMSGGGAERVVSIISNELVNRNYEVAIAVFVGTDSYYSLDDRIQFISADYSVDRSTGIKRKLSLARNFCNSIRFTKDVIQKIEPDIVIPLLTPGEIVGYFATIGNHKVSRVVSERNDPTRKYIGTRKLKEHIYKTSDLLICQSETVASYYNCVPEQKKCVIPNPIDMSLFPTPVDESNPARVVSVGRFTPQKNMTLLVKAFSLIAEEFNDVTLTIYGEGPKRAEMEEIIRNSHLQDRILLPGASTDVLNQIKDAALFVMPSDFEGFPNALLEAMALNIPVISTDFATGVAREIVTEDYGLVVPCQDEHALANAMKQILNDPGLRKRIRNKDCNALKKFEVNNIIDMWDKALTAVIDNNK